jgi:drug/metabolite transporter (DMT)-like permease
MAEESSISIARVQAGAAVPARERALATAAILLAASGLGAASMFAKLAYGEGVGVTTLLFIRYIAAVLLLVPVVLLRRKRGALWTGALLLWAPAAVWYVTSAITFWSALRLGNVTQVAPVAYLYPAIVAIIGAVFHHERLGGARMTSIVCAIAGSALIFGVPSTSSAALGARLLSVGTAVTAALYYIAAGQAVRRSDPVQGTVILTSVGALVMLPAMLITGLQGSDTSAGWAYVGGVVVVGGTLPFVLVLAGLTRIPSTQAALLTLLEPVVAVSLALIVLGESVDRVQLVGILLALAAMVLANVGSITRTATAPDALP